MVVVEQTVNLLVCVENADILRQVTKPMQADIKSQCRNISRISNQLRKIEFWFIPSKQPFGMIISKNDIKKSPSALHFKNFRKVRKFTKNTIFIHEISLNFERFQRNITGAKKLLLTSSSSHIWKTSKALRLCKHFKQNSFVNIIPGLRYSPTLRMVF